MKKIDYFVVGPDPRRTDIANPGGQLTATSGLLQFAADSGLELAFIDTLQGSFPVPPVHVRVTKAVRRLLQVLWHSTLRRPRRGMIIFSAGPGSFLERGFAGLIARLLGVKTVVCLRSGSLLPYLGAASSLGRVITALIRLQPRILVQGHSWLPILERAGVNSSRIRVVANWIGPAKQLAERPRRARRDHPIRFVFVGWLVAEKGVRELIEACEQLAASGSVFHLTVVGGGTLHKEIAQRVEVAKLHDRVSVLGWVDPGDVATLMDEADVFVLPTYFEGFPNALIEAFALGLPAISTPVGAIPDSLVDGENGFLVTPGNSKHLAVAMGRYIANPSLVAQQSVRALETVVAKHDFRTNCASLFAAVEG